MIFAQTREEETMFVLQEIRIVTWENMEYLQYVDEYLKTITNIFCLCD